MSPRRALRTWRCILIRVKSHIPIKLQIDDEQTLVLGAKRLTFKEANELKAQYRAAQNTEGEEANALWIVLIQECFENYVSLDSEVEIEFADGGKQKLRKAEELLDFFGGNFKMLVAVVLSVISQSSLDQKKEETSPRHTDSSPSSEERDPAHPGPKPETTATSAGNGDSAESADVPQSVAPPSGSTEEASMESPRSSSTSAPSLP